MEMGSQRVKLQKDLKFCCPMDGERLVTTCSDAKDPTFFWFKGRCRKCGRDYSITIDGHNINGQSIDYWFREKEEKDGDSKP